MVRSLALIVPITKLSTVRVLSNGQYPQLRFLMLQNKMAILVYGLGIGRGNDSL